MIELDRGHTYQLDNLKDSGYTYLHFFKDPALHKGEGQRGPSTQEVIRACIARVKHLNTEKYWWGNRFIILFLRTSIFLFELRALLRKAKKANGIEHLKTRKDGHVF